MKIFIKKLLVIATITFLFQRSKLFRLNILIKLKLLYSTNKKLFFIKSETFNFESQSR